MQVPRPVLPLPVMWLQHPPFQIQPARVPSEEQVVLLELCSLPWVLGLGSLLLQEKGQVKQLVMGWPQSSPRPLPERHQLIQEPVMDQWELFCRLHLLPHLRRGLHHLGQLARLLTEQAFKELVQLAVP